MSTSNLYSSTSTSTEYYISGYFHIKPGTTRLVQILEPRGVRTKYGVFGDGRFNGAIQIFRGPISVAMVTKFGLLSNTIGHNSALQMPELPNSRFSDTANLMWYINFSFVHF